jgi:antitoxin VapB
MTDEQKAKLFRNGGSQAVRLPAEFRFEGDEVYITRNEATGDVVLSERPRRETWRAFIAWRDALDIAWEGVEGYMAERPMNRSIDPRGVFEGEV